VRRKKRAVIWTGAGAANRSLCLTLIVALTIACVRPAARPGEVVPAPDLVGDTTGAWGDDEINPCIPDAQRALAALDANGATLGFHLNSDPHLSRRGRHWQGVQRAAGANAQYLFVSRSGASVAAVVVRMSSRNTAGDRFGSNLPEEGPPPEEDRVVAELPGEAGLTHAGGLKIIGNILALPIDGHSGSRVVFYDITSPENPRRLGMFDHSDALPPSDPHQASNVGITRLRDGRYLMVIGVHSSKVLDFYVSSGTSLRDSLLHFVRLTSETSGVVRGFQSLSLVTQCDGAIYLVGTHNTAVPPPSMGKDYVRWYRLVSPGPGRVGFESAGSRHLHCHRCNFGAGGGLFIDSRRGILVYGLEHVNSGPGHTVVVEEFGPP
jgi:hypothetical protein